MNPLNIYPVKNDKLLAYFKNFNFKKNTKHVQNYLKITIESGTLYQTTFHDAFNFLKDESFGFVALRMSNGEIDDVPGVIVDFLYLKEEYRAKLIEGTEQKYSFFILDYIIEKAIEIQSLAAVNHVYLVPINDKVRAVYLEYGFENIPSSGTNEWEDYMVFNLLDEDPSII